MSHTTHLDLVVQQHPQNLFFKDKGGKRNQLNFKISLGSHRGLTLLRPIPLKLGLYTEHDAKVEDEDINKKVLWTHKENYDISPDDDVVDIWFRIEKVSSKLGLFKIYVGPGKGAEDVSSYFTQRNNKQPCPPGSVILNGVYSSLIEVRSKVNELGNRPRPMGNNDNNLLDSSTNNLLMTSLGEINEEESALAGAVTQIGEALRHVSSAVTTLEQRISILHKRLAVVEAQISNNNTTTTTTNNRNNNNTVNNSFTGQLQYTDNTGNTVLVNTTNDNADDDENADTVGNGDSDSDAVSEAPYQVQENDYNNSNNDNINNDNTAPLINTPANATIQLHSMNGVLPPTLAAAVAAANTGNHHHHHPTLNTPTGPGSFINQVMQPSAVRMSSPNLMGSPNWGMSITGSPPGLNLGANAISTNNHHNGTTTLSSSANQHSKHAANTNANTHLLHTQHSQTINQMHTTGHHTELPSAVSGGGSPTADPSYVLRSLTVPSTYDALFTAPISNPPIPNLTGLVGHRDSFDYADPSTNELYGHNDNDAVDGNMFDTSTEVDTTGLAARGSNNRRGARKRSIVVEHGVDDVMAAAVLMDGQNANDNSYMSRSIKRGRPGRAYSEISVGNAWDG